MVLLPVDASYLVHVAHVAGMPNACNGCHADQSAEWATDTVTRWHGSDRAETFHYGETYVNLADLYRESGREQEGEALLRRALELEADSADLHHVLGLLLVRRKHQVEALIELERAAELSPDNPRYAFVLAVALHSAGDVHRALEVMESAHSRRPADRDILFGLATFSRDAGDLEAAMRWAEKLVELSPTDRDARGLLAD